MKTTITEFKDDNKKNRIRIEVESNLGSNITYSSTQGYANKSEMRETAVNSSVSILKKYAPEKLK